MTALAILLAAASVGFAIVRITKLPAIPVLILTGILASWLAPVEGDFLADVLTLGVTILVFVAGIELSPTRLKSRGWVAFQVGVLQFVILGAIGLLLALSLGFSSSAAAYVALALTASSTLVVVKLLQERRMLYEPVGRLVTGVLLLQDLLIILCIPVVTRLSEGALAMVTGVFATICLMVFAGVMHRWIVPMAVKRTKLDEEALLLVSLSVLSVFMGAAYLMELPLVSGAFLAGVALSGFPSAALTRGQLNSLGDFFHVIFFTALGAFLTIPSLVELWHGMVLALAVVVLTPPLVALLAERAGFSARPALASGLLLAQTSEFSLIVALQGLALGHLDTGVFTVIALFTVTTMILTPFIADDRVAWRMMRLHPFRPRQGPEAPPEGHILMLGCGRHGQALLESLIVSRDQLVVVDDDPALIDRLRRAGVTALRGDISDIELLRSVGADRAKVVISTVRRREENAPLLAFARDVPVLVRGFNVEDGTWIEARGGHPILYSEAAAEDFREWYETEWEQAAARDG